jgi:hypothetical protein
MRFPELERMREDMKADLPAALPCPFCGHPYIDLEGHKSVTVVCQRCKAEGPPGLDYGPVEAMRVAIIKWNNRFPLEPRQH